MAIKIKRLKQHPIMGVVVDTRYHKEREQLEHLMRYPDEHGNIVDRWFLDSQLEAAEEQAPADAQEEA